MFYGIDSIADTLGEQAGRIVKLIQTAENDMASVKGELDAVVSTTIMSSRAKYLIEYMNSNLRLGQFLEDLDEDSQ